MSREKDILNFVTTLKNIKAGQATQAELRTAQATLTANLGTGAIEKSIALVAEMIVQEAGRKRADH